MHKITKLAVFGLIFMCCLCFMFVAMKDYWSAWRIFYYFSVCILALTTLHLLRKIFPKHENIARILSIIIFVGWLFLGYSFPLMVLKQIEVKKEFCGQVNPNLYFPDRGGVRKRNRAVIFTVQNNDEEKVFRMAGKYRSKIIRTIPYLCLTYVENENWSDYPMIVSYEINENKNERKHIH